MSEKKEATAVVKALVAAADQLPALTRLFFGDVTMEESEISWIKQTEVGKLLMAYPRLEHFGVRGGTDLSFQKLTRHDALKSLIVETGGLSRKVVQQILAADLPALEHLELWLGAAEYGADTTVADLQPLLTGDRFPNLRYLGLRDSEIADELAVALAHSPLLARIKILDLSLGTLGDVGAEALLNSPAVAGLEKLDLHHHYCSKKMMKRLKALPIPVDASDRQEADEEDEGEAIRYVAVGE
jgi:hypothetical protein